jgi:hypothetical protein
MKRLPSRFATSVDAGTTRHRTVHARHTVQVKSVDEDERGDYHSTVKAR